MRFSLAVLHRVASTNAWLADRAAQGAPEGEAVLAHEQAAGRGRHGRDWHSPPGNLHLSALLRPDSAPDAVGQLGMLAALAVADALAPLVEPRLKWPNDVLVDGRKIAGILVETGMASGRIAWAVIGMGVNLAAHPELPDRPATSLAALGHPPPAPQDFAAIVLDHLAARVAAWRAQGFAAQRAAWLARGPAPGAAIGVRLPQGSVAGSFAGLDRMGALLLETPAGPRTIAAGDVFAI
jgi:BirA family biotin operon repressor/biotin-[acetyl-CoA-carboxylase] ligase